MDAEIQSSALTTYDKSQFLSPVVSVEDAVTKYKTIKSFINQILVEGTDYGTIPGAGTKKVLLKPGAEKMCTIFGLRPEMVLIREELDWDKGFFLYIYECRLWKGDTIVATYQGACNSYEKKYRYRTAKAKCPQCGKEEIIKGREEYGGGWLCWKKNGGCGAKYLDGDELIESQPVGQIPNPDIADTHNTIMKMAQKRAFNSTVVLATNTGDNFTLDVEDFQDLEDPEAAQHKTPTPLNAKEKAIRLLKLDCDNYVESIKDVTIVQKYKEWKVKPHEIEKWKEMRTKLKEQAAIENPPDQDTTEAIQNIKNDLLACRSIAEVDAYLNHNAERLDNVISPSESTVEDFDLFLADLRLKLSDESTITT